MLGGGSAVAPPGFLGARSGKPTSPPGGIGSGGLAGAAFYWPKSGQYSGRFLLSQGGMAMRVSLLASAFIFATVTAAFAQNPADTTGNDTSKLLDIAQSGNAAAKVKYADRKSVV